MSATLEQGRYVNVVGTVNLTTGDAQILYVNPTTTRITAPEPGHSDVELVFEDDGGRELARVHPTIRTSSCESGGTSATGLIQEDVPVEPGMRRMRVLFKGRETAQFEAGQDAAAPPAAGLALGPAAPGRPNRRSLELAAQVKPEPGTSYSVLAKPDGGDAWHAIAVGRETPTVDIDLNQFPGAKHVDVRVMRSTGFDERLIAEERLSTTPRP